MKCPLRALLIPVLLAMTPILSSAAVAAEDGEIDRIVAVVDDDVILESELTEQMRAVQQQLSRQSTEAPPENVLRRQVLERMVVTKLQLQVAARNNLKVDDDALNKAVANIAAQNGVSLQQFRAVLEREGYDYATFRETIRDQMTVTMLQQRQVNNLVTITDQEVDNYVAGMEKLGEEGDEYHLAHILIATPEAASPDQVRDARAKVEQVIAELGKGADFRKLAVAVSQGQQALEGGDLGWRTAAQIPSMFIDLVKQLQVGQVSEPVRSPSGFHLVKLIDKRGIDKHLVTQYHVRHILLKPNELLSDDEVRIRIDQLQQRIEGGEDFATLARSHSEDVASASKGGDLGWAAAGDLVPQFVEVMVKQPLNSVSAPFRTQYGWHILQVDGKREHDDTDEYKRNRAREMIRKRKSEEELEIWLHRLRDEAYVEYRLDDQ
jgi:peptidyl-prolyl cis-trans isomerase SurA